MSNKQLNLSARATARNKRAFSKPLLLAAALSLSAVALPAAASTWWSATPSISIGSKTINVRNKGAVGNGSHDDTSAFQAAINALPSSGGTVYVPAGRYMIDATKSIRMRSHTRLQMASGAELDAIPNGAGRYHVIKIWNVNNVKIQGGAVVGDRARHRGTSGEWGYGINISGSSHVLVSGTKVSNCWGDGVLIGALGSGRSLDRSDYVTLNHVVSSNNRRQGMSIGPSHHVYIVNSTFKDTQGTLPQAGIDIEPQLQGPVDTVRIQNSTLSGNRGNGLELHANISGIVMTGTTMKDNHGFGMLAISAPGLTIASNVATRNGLAGVGLSGSTHNVLIKGNSLTSNSTRYMSPTALGGGTSRDLSIGSKTWAITVSGNTLSAKKR